MKEKIEYELRYSPTGDYYFIDKIVAGEGFTIAILRDGDNEIADVEEMIRRANESK